jgi:hypothetical protein
VTPRAARVNAANERQEPLRVIVEHGRPLSHYLVAELVLFGAEGGTRLLYRLRHGRQHFLFQLLDEGRFVNTEEVESRFGRRISRFRLRAVTSRRRRRNHSTTR